MRWMLSIFSLVACTLLFAAGHEKENANVLSPVTFGDTAGNYVTLASLVSPGEKLFRSNYDLRSLHHVLNQETNTQFLMGVTDEGRKIHAYYIPGKSTLRALVIAGAHGSELSSVEVAYQLLKNLLNGDKPYYSVIIIPSLFPDNAVKAIMHPKSIGSVGNIGRYTCAGAVDPNRQMPSPGKAFDPSKGLDHAGRPIEMENRWLLQLIQEFRPQRIANLHAIRDTKYGGVYADPRTNHLGIALGFDSDSSLAVDIAVYIHNSGGHVAGNKLPGSPTALYYKDPAPAAAGSLQKRNMTGSALNGKRGSGVSLGTWASTAVFDKKDSPLNREAMRILTIEYPGYKRPYDYSSESQQLFQQRQTALFASAIELYFLGEHYTESNSDIFLN